MIILHYSRFSSLSTIVDFGLCVDLSLGDRTHMVGSPFWIPPEMIRNQPHGFAVRYPLYGYNERER